MEEARSHADLPTLIVVEPITYFFLRDDVVFAAFVVVATYLGMMVKAIVACSSFQLAITNEKAPDQQQLRNCPAP